MAAELRRLPFEVVPVGSAEEARREVAALQPQIVLLDLRLPDGSGLDVLRFIREASPGSEVIVLTGHGSIDTAIESVRMGAFDYVAKPCPLDELELRIQRAIERQSLQSRTRLLERGLTPPDPGCSFVGDSAEFRHLLQLIERVAPTDSTVLVTGETGSGKEMVARLLHARSPRRQRPFVTVECAALQESLLQSELFGHERGAFTGADRLRKGRFELADRGTLVLDEVSEVSPAIQAKLLRVLQERAFERVGSSLTIGVDVRVIATSNRDLPAAAAQGEFRQDLFFRLNVLPVRLPPLRERAEDVPLLAAHFLAEVARREGRQGVRFDEGALALLRAYTWPGNVRELQNICERAVVLRCAPGGGDASRVISRDMIEPWLLPHARPLGGVAHAPIGANGAYIEPKAPAPELNGAAGDALPTLEEIERSAIVQTLRRFNGHRQRTARALGIGVRTLGLKLKKWKQLQLVSQEL